MLAIPSELRVHPITDQSEWPFMRPPVSMVAASHPLHLVRLGEVDALFALLTASIASSLAGKQDLISLATDRLVGRDTAGTGAIESISLTGGLEFSGSGSIRIADGGVTLAKMANLTAPVVIGRADGSGTGAPVALSVSQLITIIATEGIPAVNVLVATDPFTGSLDGFSGTTVQELFEYIDANFAPP